MKQPVYFILTLLLCGFFSCNSPSPSGPLFESADSLVELYPDSLLALLDEMDVDRLSNAQQAEYALLMVQAMDKNYIPQPNDSLIKVALEYYKDHPEQTEQLGKAYFYLGYTYENFADDAAAIEAYLAALQVLGEKGETRLHLFANISLASCYFYQEMYERAMERNRTAYHLALRLGDTSRSYFPLRSMGLIFASEMQADSALFYYEKALDVARELDDSARGSIVLYDIAQLYSVHERYNEANEAISEAIALSSSNRKNYYNLKGDVLSKLNQPDSAKYYLDAGLDISNIYKYVSSVYSLYNLEKGVGNYENAVRYADDYILYYDSIQHLRQREEIAQLMDDHALESHKKEVLARQQRITSYIVIGFFALLSLCVYIFFSLDRKKKKEMIRLQQDLIQNRMELSQMETRLQSSVHEVEIERRKKEEAQSELVERQKDLSFRLLEAMPAYKPVHDYVAAKQQRKFPKDMSEKDRQKLKESVYEIYGDFMRHCVESYPQLSEVDVYCCVLTHIGFPNVIIAYLVGVDANVVTQRRYRIKGKMPEDGFNTIFNTPQRFKI